MALKVPNVGELELLDEILREDDFELHLYKNDYTPVDDSELADFTEADFEGYASEALTNWVAAVTDANGRAFTHADSLTFTKGTGGVSNTVYGYYVVNASNSELVWAERFLAGIVMDTDGKTFTILPIFTLRSEF